MHKITTLIIVLGLLVLFGCGGGSSMTSEPDLEMPDLPEWVTNPSHEEGVYIGIGSSRAHQYELRRNMADAAARTDIANYVRSACSRLTQSILLEGGGTRLNETAQREVTETVTSSVMRGVRISKRHMAKDGTIHSLARLDLDEAQGLLEHQFRKEEARHIRNLLSEGIQDMDERVEKKLDSPDSGQ